ncbi:MAG: OmpA family protein, partial [Eubacteriales bacterium]|nr:OmpA family protein [Eubacteriales bacterium]
GMFREALEALTLINMEGNTDNRTIHTAKYEDNWDLSTKRATNVIRYMLERGNLPQNMVACAGYGEYQPIATNDTEEGRQQNRRVQFVLKKKIVALVSSEK